MSEHTAVAHRARTTHLIPTNGLESRSWRLVALGVLGLLAAAAVGYLVSRNPHAAPAHVAVELRVALIVAPLMTGIYSLTERGQARMGGLLVGASLYSCLWLLNGAGERLAFSVGLLAAGASPAIYSYLILADPRGRLRYGSDRAFLAIAGGALPALWTILVLTSAGPPVKTPLISCASACPTNVFHVASLPHDVATALTAALWISWATVTLGTPLLLARKLLAISRPLREPWVPVEIAACLIAACWTGFLVARLAGSSAAGALGAAYVEVALGVPLAILLKLGIDRASMGRALASFVDHVAASPRVDLRALMARALNDPSLQIAYPHQGSRTYVDASGDPIEVPEDDPDRAVVWIDPAYGPVAAVIYDASLADQSAFVHAAGAAATIRLEAEYLEAELHASTGQLAASRLRLLEAADAERQRIERDLHDGVQQQIVGLRLKLDMASDAVKDDPARGERMLDAVGRELDELLGSLRMLAKGIYPSILKERGLKEALGSVSLSAPIPVAVSAGHTGRYREEIEVAIYFTCVEAIQNVVKHAGPEATVAVRLSHSRDHLRFEVRDTGEGFDVGHTPHGSGLMNMSDRIEAVGGHLWLVSKAGVGTSVRGRVPAEEIPQPRDRR